MNIEMRDHSMHSDTSTARIEIVTKSVLAKEEHQEKLELMKVECKSGSSHAVIKYEVVENMEAI